VGWGVQTPELPPASYAAGPIDYKEEKEKEEEEKKKSTNKFLVIGDPYRV